MQMGFYLIAGPDEHVMKNTVKLFLINNIITRALPVRNGALFFVALLEQNFPRLLPMKEQKSDKRAATANHISRRSRLKVYHRIDVNG